MGRFVLRYDDAGSGSAPAAHLESIRSTAGVQVLDASPKMMLVDGGEAALRDKLKAMPGWSMHPEQEIPLPDTRQTIGK